MQKKNILIVEDEYAISLTLKTKLTLFGYNVVDIIADGKSAVESAQRTLPDLILMDISLAGEYDGITAARQIRKFSDIPVIFLTALSDEEILESVKDINPSGFLIKPFDDKELKFNIIIALQKYESEKKLRENEEALIESREQYRELIENQGEGVGFVDADEVFTFANPAAEKIFGVREGGLSGKSLKEFLDPVQVRIVENETRNRMNGQNSTYELEIRRPDGKHIYILTTVSAKFDKNGKFLGSFGIFRDISEQKIAREEIQKALEKEKELSELKSRFISTVSHEYRTPLTSILTSSELLERYKDKWSDEKKSEVLNRIQRSVDYMIGLLNDVLTINKVDSGKIDFNPVTLDLVKICRESFDEISLQVNENYEMIFVSSSPSIFGRYDDKLLRQIIANLFSNAVKYSPSGGRIKFEISELSSMVEIKLEDQGIGISEEDQKQIFEPFFRGMNVSTISGTGLGLSIVKRALDLHGGTISIISSKDKGTQFTINLPQLQ